MRRKQRHIIALLIGLAFLSACDATTREARRMVKRAEQLADTLPDSTVRLIDSVLRMPASFSERERMDMVLTHTLALYKWRGTDLLYAAEHTSSELSQACAYFAKKKDYEKATKAALYMGYMLDEMGDNLKEAVKYLKDAEYYGTLSHDTLFVAKAQYRLAYLILEFDQTLGENFTSQEGIDLLDKAAKGYKSDDYFHLAKLLDIKTLLYAKIQEFDHAEECAKTSLGYAEQCHNIELRNSALQHLSLIYRKQGKIEESIDCIRSCFASGDTIGMPNFLYQIATSFYAQNELDSANYYFNRLEHLLSILEKKDEEKAFKMKCYNMISHFYEDQGNDSLALYYVRKHEGIYYKQVASSAEKNVYNIQHQYDYEVLQNKMNKEIMKRQRVIIWIVFILMLLLIGLVISQIRLAQKNKKEAETKANLFHFMQQNKELTQISEEQKQNQIYLTQKHKESEQAYEELLKEKEKQEQNAAEYGEKLSLELKKEQSIMLRLHLFLQNQGDDELLKKLEKTVFGKQAHLDAMMENVDRLYPQLRETIKQEELGLDENEQLDVIMSYFNISRQDEALLLEKTTDMVDKIRNRSRKKIQSASKGNNLPKIM